MATPPLHCAASQPSGRSCRNPTPVKAAAFQSPPVTVILTYLDQPLLIEQEYDNHDDIGDYTNNVILLFACINSIASIPKLNSGNINV